MAMTIVGMHEAKSQLSKLIRQACEGERIVIARGTTPVVRLVPLTRTLPRRVFGSLKGKVRVGDAFFEPLSEDELAGWE
jgi:prevent-host-death family protein